MTATHAMDANSGKTESMTTQPERVQMHRRYQYRNGETAKILITDLNNGEWPVISWSFEAGLSIEHDATGLHFAGAGESEFDLLPLPESEQPVRPREWKVIALRDGSLLSMPEAGLQASKKEGYDVITVREVTEGGGK